jgi:hypothetical protein
MRDQRQTPGTPQPPALRPPHARRVGASQTRRAYRGWVRTALTQPPPPIVGVSRNLSTEPVDRTRTTGEGRQWQAAAAPRARRATRRAKRAEAPSQATTGHRAAGPHPAAEPRNASPPQARTGQDHPDHAPASHGEQDPSRRQPAPRGKRQLRHRVRNPPGKTPGQTGNASHRSQAAVRNPCPANRTLKTKQASNSHATASHAIFE